MHSKETCRKSVRSIHDTMDIVGGKWKLVLITNMLSGSKRFTALVRETGISPRVLSKELHELEMNGLVTRTVQNIKPIIVEYSLTSYSHTLNEVLMVMDRWGQQHRTKIINGSEK